MFEIYSKYSVTKFKFPPSVTETDFTALDEKRRCETAMLRRRVPVESDIVDGGNLTRSSVYFEYISQCLAAVDTTDSLWLVSILQNSLRVLLT